MLTVSYFFRISKSESPVTKCEQPESNEAARMRLSSASRQMLMIETTRRASVCRSTKKVIKRACRCENPNFKRSFSSTSSKTSRDAANLHVRRVARHTRRQNPSVVKMASQTLLSRRTRTRQGENFFFRQAAFAWQTVESRQRAIHFVIRRKKILIDALDLLIGQPLDFFDDLSCIHVSNVITAAKKSEQEIRPFIKSERLNLNCSSQLNAVAHDRFPPSPGAQASVLT